MKAVTIILTSVMVMAAAPMREMVAQLSDADMVDVPPDMGRKRLEE